MIDATPSLDLLRHALIEHAPTGPLLEERLRSVIAESAARPGKLMRGRLVQAVSDAVGIDAATALHLAAAVEYFHLASLLLDDLPCMDNAVTRRGEPCAHRVHGEATAILAALAFINRAYALAGFAFAGWPREVRLQVHALLDACLGAAGLVGGQARDLAFTGSDHSPREVSGIALSKTTALLWLALLLPALASSVRAEEVRHLKALCLYWGLALQAVDDLRDVLATSVDAGKSTGRDRALDRPNLALALGVPSARTRVQRLVRQAAQRIERLTAIRPAWSSLGPFQREFERGALPQRAAGGAVAA